MLATIIKMPQEFFTIVTFKTDIRDFLWKNYFNEV